MHCRRTTGLALLVLAMAGTALAAERATVADAAERRDQAVVRHAAQEWRRRECHAGRRDDRAALGGVSR